MLWPPATEEPTAALFKATPPSHSSSRHALLQKHWLFFLGEARRKKNTQDFQLTVFLKPNKQISRIVAFVKKHTLRILLPSRMYYVYTILLVESEALLLSDFPSLPFYMVSVVPRQYSIRMKLGQKHGGQSCISGLDVWECTCTHNPYYRQNKEYWIKPNRFLITANIV